MKKTFILQYDIDVTLDVDELWPDGDAPDDPTVADVVALIKRCGGWRKVISDWNLDDGLTGTVTEMQLDPRLLKAAKEITTARVAPATGDLDVKESQEEGLQLPQQESRTA